IYNYIDPKFGDDFFGKMKKQQFLGGAADSLFQTLLNLKQELKLLNKSYNTSFECSKDGFLIEKSIN
ncbi:MAG: hypothetical protein ACRENO_02320, partial [Thermodesulfobacteriota bacterium]